MIFIADAIDQLSDAIWGNDDPSLDDVRRKIGTWRTLPERTGILWEMAKMFEALLAEGMVTAYGRLLNGSGTTVIRNREWDSEATLSAVTRGSVTVVDSSGVLSEQWIFLDRVEFDILMLLYSPTGPRDDLFGNLKQRHDALADLVLGNLSAIARAQHARHPAKIGPGPARIRFLDDPTPEQFETMFQDARRTLEPRHQIALEELMAAWLVARFDDDRFKKLQRSQFEQMARVAFAPYFADDHCRQAWTLAIRERPGRFKPGRPRKASPVAK